MRTATVAHAADFSGWRDKARNLLVRDVDPSAINWQVTGAAQDLFAEPDSEIEASATTTQSTFRVPQSFMQLATRVVCHSDPQRFALLYRVLWRLTHGEPDLLTCCSDNDVHVVNTLAKAVSRDIQSGALADFGHAGRNARQVLEESARSPPHSRTDS